MALTLNPNPNPHQELGELKRQLSAPTNSVETKHVQEARAWEYVARAFLHKCRLRASTPSNPNAAYSHPYPIPLPIFTPPVAQP